MIGCAEMTEAYVDNAATTQLSERAYESMLPFLRESYGNPSQPYACSRASKRAIREAREIVASCVNASPKEIYFTSGGTESDNWAIKGFALRDTKKKMILASEVEHHAVLNSCSSMKTVGHDVELIPVDANGLVADDALDARSLGENALVSVMFANNEIGTSQPIKQLCQASHASGAYFHTDAVQAIGHVPIDVKDLGIDLLSASAHKFNGPRGAGFLYVKEGTNISSYISGGSQEMGRRAGTENTAAIVGLATALKESCSQIQETSCRLREFESMLLSKLDDAGLDYVRNGIDQLPGLLSLSFRNTSGEMLMHRLDLMHIFVSTGSACDGSSTKLSHVLRAIDLPNEYAMGTIRVSFGKYTTPDEVSRTAAGIIKVLSDKESR